MESAESRLPLTMPGPSEKKRLAYDLRVLDIVRETSDACSVILDIPADLREVFRYQAGQFLTFEIPYQGTVLKRCYSLASAPLGKEAHKVTIKRVDSGRISSWFNGQLKVGDTVRVLPPEGRFVMGKSAGHAVLFAGGSGITPIISMIKTALASSARTLTLVYANRDQQSVIFRAELAMLQAAHGSRLAIVHRYDDEHGFLRTEDVAAHVSPSRDGEYFLCGPAAFMDTVERGLLAAGVPRESIHIERFLSPADPKPEVAEPVPQGTEVPSSIQIELQGTTHEVPYGGGKTLLEAALDAGIDAPYSCEEGVCGCCMARLLEGKVDMKGDEALTADEKKRGYILCCQARPLGSKCRIKFIDP